MKLETKVDKLKIEDVKENEGKDQPKKGEKTEKTNELQALELKFPKKVAKFCEICTFPEEYCVISHPLLKKRKELTVMAENSKKEDEPNDIKTSGVNTANDYVGEGDSKKTDVSVFENKDNKDGKESKNIEKKEETKEGEIVEEKLNKRKKEKTNKIVIEEIKRGKHKHVTYVNNLEKFGINLKDTAKMLSKKFACSATVTKEENGQEGITLTGEFLYELQDYLMEKHDNLKVEDFKLVQPKTKEAN